MADLVTPGLAGLPTADDVLHFWFQELKPADHFRKSEQIDTIIRRRFSDLHSALSQGQLRSFTQSSRGKFAAIIVLDQFSRNMFRGSGKAFAMDEVALDLAKELVESGDHLAFLPEERVFIYMPYMHSENLEDQNASVELFQALQFSDNLDYALEHQNVIQRFGRFPHRNEALGRESTNDERLFVQTPGTAF